MLILLLVRNIRSYCFMHIMQSKTINFSENPGAFAPWTPPWDSVPVPHWGLSPLDPSRASYTVCFVQCTPLRSRLCNVLAAPAPNRKKLGAFESELHAIKKDNYSHAFTSTNSQIL